MKDSHDMVTCGSCCKPEREDVANGLIASACSVAQWEEGYDGCGTWKIMCGRRSGRTSKNDGSMSTPVKNLGIAHVYMLKVGENRCLIASPSPAMGQPMSPDAMYERSSRQNLENVVRKRCCCTSPMRFGVFDEGTWPRMSAFVWKRRMLQRIRSCAAMSSRPLLSLSSPTSDLQHRLLPTALNLLLRQHHHPHQMTISCLLSNPPEERLVMPSG